MARPTARTKERTPQTSTGSGVVAAVRRRWVGLVVVAVLAVAVVALVIFDQPLPGTEFPSLGNTHIASVTDPHVPYNSSPPSSGPHLGFLADWGVAEEPVPPELFVHNLEDAGVVLAYDCPDACPDFAAGLAGLTSKGRILVTAYDGIVDPDEQSHRGAAVAWTRIFYFDELDSHTLSEIETFIDLYEGIDHHVRAVS